MSNDYRANGPWDESEVVWDDTERLDLGSLLVTAIPGVDVQVQVDENTGAVALVTLATPDSGVQIQVFAAPKSGGLWDDARKQITASINSSNGLVEEAQGVFGPELRAQVPGEQGLQPACFVGIEGPRWFMRAVFLGNAARPGEAATILQNAVRGLVVIRGNEAMPVGNALTLTLPTSQEQEVEAEQESPLLPPERGPELTEIR
ncbi:MAG: DUF3710 domain-containing protein [Actinobacteria bacterium]|uniref:Unannotated protein n=1 Tax=freshwater metagenome TaxID=449393 RepID=A0A6J7SIL1_9ZZZZ|nr:DUF3710 domain-containing protein [Actinomycetota bacterium]MTB28276.1 DUF3710 domain-containing protein [Actinomycetota bacterium]